MTTVLCRLFAKLDRVGLLFGLLSLRLLLGWDFFESGWEKLGGENWFGEIQDRFPLPFRLLPPEVGWHLATWFELVGSIALVIGFGTRFFSALLIVLTWVAIASVHWPDTWLNLPELMQGYVFTDNGHGNFKLPVLFIGMLLPLLLLGPGGLSIDDWIRRRYIAKRMMGNSWKVC